MNTSRTSDLWLIRHGEPAHDARGRCYGSLDVPLSPFGVSQATVLANTFEPSALTVLYTSPRVRCRDTAQIIADHQGCPLHVLDDLAELHFGDFEGKTYEHIASQDPEFYSRWMTHPTEVCFPGGESFRDMQQRVLNAVDRLLQSHAGTAFGIVAHGGVNRIVIANALGLPNENIFRIGQRYACLNLIRYYDEYPVIEIMNGPAVS